MAKYPGQEQTFVESERRPLVGAGLLNAAPQLPVEGLSPGGKPRWLFGVKIRGFGCGGVGFTESEDCDDDVFELLDPDSVYGDPDGFTSEVDSDNLPGLYRDGELWDGVWEPGLLYTSTKCSLLGLDEAAIRSRAEARLLDSESYYLAAQLMGTYSTPKVPNNPSIHEVLLARGETDGLISGGAPIREALAELDSSLTAALRNRQGMIHMTTGALSYLARDLIWEDGKWHTPSGHVVVADAGYQGDGPDGTSPATHHTWLYSTPMVYWALTDVKPSGGPGEEFDPTRNEISVLMQRWGMVAFDIGCEVTNGSLSWSPVQSVEAIFGEGAITVT